MLVGGGFIVTSTDGINFVRTNSFASLSAVTYAGGQFVAAGQNGAVLRPTDGLDWIASCSGTLKNLSAVAYGGGRYVAVGEGGAIRISDDGVVWSGVASGTDYSLYGAAFANGKFVAVGQLGIVLTSIDGVTWIPQNNDDFSTLYEVIYAEGRFLAVGDGGAVLVSTEGTTWNRNPSGLTNTLNHVVHGGGIYVAVASAHIFSSTSTDGGGHVFTSTDGAIWVERSQPGFANVVNTAFLNDTLLLFGGGGTIFQSDPAGGAFLGLALNSVAGTAEVTIRSEDVGGSYRLQSCTNLSTDPWFDVTNFTQIQPVTTIQVPVVPGTPRSYYRVLR